MTPERIAEFVYLARELLGSGKTGEQLHGLYLNEFLEELAASERHIERLTAALDVVARCSSDRLAEVGDCPDYATAFRAAEILGAALRFVGDHARAALDGAPVEASGE